MDNLFYNKIRKNGFWLLLVILILVQIYTGLKIEYPPSKEQLFIRTDSLLMIRMICLGLIVSGSFCIYRIVKIITNNLLVALLFIFVIMTSPVVMGLWLTRPFETFKFAVIMLGIYLMLKSKRIILFMIILTLFIVGFNYFQNSDKANIYNLVNGKELTRQTVEKFLKEDDVVDRVRLPLIFRRVAYNKISMLIRNVAKESISFWNLEEYFYQEFPPNSKKSLVIFFWPLIIPFVAGIYIIANNKKSMLLKLVSVMLFLSYINYIFSSSTENYRLILAVPLVSIIISFGLEKLWKIKWIGIAIVFLWIYGWQLFNYDFKKRPDFWLDNRPLVYKFIYENLDDIENNQPVIITDIAGNAEMYCKFYLKERCSNNITFGSFNLKEKASNSGTIYAGFQGEYLGPDLNNKFSENSQEIIISNGFEEIGATKLRDSIAYRYGELLFIGKKK
jgi:hypothetical protein